MKNIISLKIFLTSKIFLFGVIVISGLFLRFYNFENLNPFGWDQVDNAWAAEKIIINNEFPLVGMQAKGNSGIFIGPLYYYFVALVYYLTDLDPAASSIIAIISSLLSLSILFFVTSRLFNSKIAIIAIFLQSFATASILADRVQWPVNFIPSVALLILYFLYKSITGDSRYILYLAAAIGFSLHIHFTSIFYVIIVILALPFISRTKQTFKFMLYGLVIGAVFMSPIIYYIFSNQSVFLNINHYGKSSYHGFHLKRVMQLVGDAFIQFDFFIKYDFLKPLKYLFLPLFIIIFNHKRKNHERFLLSYLIILFFLVPWMVMSTYSGELSDYYFSANKFVVVIIISYLLYSVYSLKFAIYKILVILVLFLYGIFGVTDFFKSNINNPISSHREKALDSIERDERIEFKEGTPESYFYYFYMYKKGIKVY